MSIVREEIIVSVGEEEEMPITMAGIMKAAKEVMIAMLLIRPIEATVAMIAMAIAAIMTHP